MYDRGEPLVTMKIEQLYVYPIKSLRGVSIPSATLTPHGIVYDRCFMLLKDHKDSRDERYENMHVAYFPQMCLFTTAIPFLRTAGDVEIEVTYTDVTSNASKTLKIPASPDTTHLLPVRVNMHQSPVTAYAMPQTYSDWFSSCFGFDVVFAYLGVNNYRPVLGNFAPNAAVRNPVRRERYESQHKKSSVGTASWLSRFVNSMPGLPTVLNPGIVDPVDDDEAQDYQITFADCAPYLIASTTSLVDVSLRLPREDPMDITKFRPNIIVSGAERAFEEDFWAEMSITSSSDLSSDEARITLTTNCVRCVSINVDYKTGAFGAGEAGQVFRKLQKDRRIDRGHKYNPVFGRYGFLSRDDQGVAELKSIKVGDQVMVMKKNEEHTVMHWPGIGQTPKTDLFAL